MDKQAEYINIMEAARRCGLSDKTIRRAIASHKLPAERLKSNVVRIAVSDLQAWRELSTDARDRRIADLETRMQSLEQQVQQLTELVGQLSRQEIFQPDMPGQPLKPLAEVMHLNQFADMHGMSRNEAERQWSMGLIAGQREPGKGRRKGQIIIEAAGMREFWGQFHNHPGFIKCDYCPHNQDISLDRSKLRRVTLVKHEE